MMLGLASGRPLTIALGLLVLAFLYDCYGGEQEESSSADATSQDRNSADTGQTEGGDSNGARQELGSDIA